METQIFPASTERLVRAAILMVLVDAFALFFLWDGYIGYQQEDAGQLAELLGLPRKLAPRVNPRVTRSAAMRLLQAPSKRNHPQSIRDAFGKPSVEHENVSYYVGPGGWLALRKNDAPQTFEWTDAEYTETDQAWQRYIGYMLAAVSLITTFLFIKTASSRITLGEKGLEILGYDRVSWDAMSGILREPDGTIALKTTDSEMIRLDPSVYRGVDRMVETICRQKGFANPLLTS